MRCGAQLLLGEMVNSSCAVCGGEDWDTASARALLEARESKVGVDWSRSKWEAIFILNVERDGLGLAHTVGGVKQMIRLV